MTHYLLHIIGFVSLLLFPYKLSKLFSTFGDYISSKRFQFLTKNGGHIYIERPFYIIVHKYITYGSFSSHTRLRVECWDKYNNTHFTPSIIIGENVCFNYRWHIGAIDKIQRGHNVLIGSNQRNNSLHYGSDAGVEMATTYHSVIGMVKLHGSSFFWKRFKSICVQIALEYFNIC